MTVPRLALSQPAAAPRLPAVTTFLSRACTVLDHPTVEGGKLSRRGRGEEEERAGGRPGEGPRATGEGGEREGRRAGVGGGRAASRPGDGGERAGTAQRVTVNKERRARIEGGTLGQAATRRPVRLRCVRRVTNELGYKYASNDVPQACRTP